ncbi:MAG: hypothetical protein MUE46_13640 [Xanthomonadales bacterium]|jgi:hypothetical protein|nr:hypothetical protein [Xanthomonadales bacterium]
MCQDESSLFDKLSYITAALLFSFVITIFGHGDLARIAPPNCVATFLADIRIESISPMDEYGQQLIKSRVQVFFEIRGVEPTVYSMPKIDDVIQLPSRCRDLETNRRYMALIAVHARRVPVFPCDPWVVSDQGLVKLKSGVFVSPSEFEKFIRNQRKTCPHPSELITFFP